LLIEPVEFVFILYSFKFPAMIPLWVSR